MEIQTITHFSEPVHVAVLPNGFTLIHIERKSEFVTAKFVVAGGAMDDVIEGEAHFLEHLVHGGRHRGGSHPALRQFVDTHGIKSGNATTNQFSTSYYGRVWRKNAREFIEILGELVSNPELDEAAVKAEVGVIQSEIIRDKDKASLRERFLSELFPSRRDILHSTAGSLDSIASITVESLKNFHRKIYSKHRSALVMSGSLDLHEVSEWISPYVERLPDGNRDERIRKITYEPEQFGFRRFSDKRIQSIGLDFLNHGPDAGLDMILLNIKNVFFFHDEYGKLYRRLRHERGLVYNVGSSTYNWPMHMSGLSIDGIPEKDVDEVLETTLSIMNSANLTMFDTDRLEWIKRDYLMQETGAMEDPVSTSRIIDLWLRDRLLSYNPRENLKTVEMLVPQDMLEIHRKYWNPDRMLIIRTDPA